MTGGGVLSLGFGVKADLSGAEDRAEESADADAALVERARKGDVQAFQILVDRYQSRAHAIALGVVGSYEDAEDVVQEAFLKAYRNLGLFRGQSSFYTWLYRIVFNLAIDLSRKRYRHVETSVGEQSMLEVSPGQAPQAEARLLAKSVSPDEKLERTELADEIRAAIESLSPEHRTVIILREIEGLSYSEIADVVGCSKGTVMSRLHHARKRLQRALVEFAPSSFKGAVSFPGGSDNLNFSEGAAGEGRPRSSKVSRTDAADGSEQGENIDDREIVGEKHR